MQPLPLRLLPEPQRKRLHRHSPFEEPPEWLQIADNTTFWDQTYGSMLKAVDSGIGNVTQELVKQGMWDSAFIVLTGDNGGQCMDPNHPADVPYGPGNSWPLYGRKCTPWEGGTRSAALVSGGLIPAALRGTQSTVLMHVADWYLLRQTFLSILSPFQPRDIFDTRYATLATLARVDPADPVEIGGAIHDVDAHDYLPAIFGKNRTNPRPYLPVTAWSLLHERSDGSMLKVMTGAYRSNYFLQNGSQIDDVGQAVGQAPGLPCVAGKPTNNKTGGVFPPKDPKTHGPLAGKCLVCSPLLPCLFDVISDESESHNLANQPEHAADVEHLAQRLASYSHYVDGSMTREELEPYECVPHSLDNNSAHALAQDAWWNNFQGPCCRKRRDTAEVVPLKHDDAMVGNVTVLSSNPAVCSKKNLGAAGQRLNVACTDGALKLDDDQAWRQDRLAISMWVDPMVPLEQLDARYAELRDANFTVCRGYFIITLDNILLKVFLKINKVSYDRSSWRKRGSGRQTAPAA